MSLDLRYFSSLSSLLLVTATVAIARPSYGWGAIATALEISQTKDNFYAQSPPTAPEEAEVYYNRGLVRYSQGDLAGAVEDYTRAIELNPENALIYNNRGIARVEQGDLVGAIADYTRAIEIDPNYALAYDNRGNARRNQGDLAGAIADHTRAIEP
ncbi:MAG: tetratricopeptide repeat protein [Leptolyngbyaceae cyanobacterium SM1_4_3]|nr:tetratricopeptide repeat protein [Leptolyngbyaceae cyanobacterium SM1_4_3]